METLILSRRDHIRAVGVRLRQLIDALGLPYVRAAEDMGVSKSQLGNWMRGNAGYPRPYELYRFARTNGVSLDWVWLGDPSGLREPIRRALLGLESEPAGQQAAASQASESRTRSKRTKKAETPA